MLAKNEILKGWKEIADYLGRDARSVQRWEKTRGLPIHRTAEGRRGGQTSVYAGASELDVWQRGGAVAPEPTPDQDLPASGAHRDYPISAYLRIAVLLLGGLVFAGSGHPSNGGANPATVALERGQLLTARSSNGDSLWQKRFNPGAAPALVADDPAPILMDVDHDGRDEVVFALKHVSFEAGEKDRVICYSAAGNEIWSYEPGAKIALGGMSLPDAFRIATVRADGRLAGGVHYIVTVANHRLLSASQVTILTPRGRKIGEYWHVGWVFDAEVIDLNRDGIDEIVLGGIDDVAGKAFLAVIAPETPKSISPVPEGYAPGIPMHEELAYYLFPTPKITSLLGRASRVVNLYPYKNPAGLMVEVQQQGDPDILERTYLLDPGLCVLRMQLSDQFLLQGENLEKHGLLARDWQAVEWPRLRALEVVR